jgi:hypothetical protein
VGHPSGTGARFIGSPTKRQHTCTHVSAVCCEVPSGTSAWERNAVPDTEDNGVQNRIHAARCGVGKRGVVGKREKQHPWIEKEKN